MLLLIDNYDSFVYNIFQYLSTDNTVEVVRNDQFDFDYIRQMNPEAIFLSPGPGYPKDAGLCIETAKEFIGQIPIMGICLGSQIIVEAMGGKTVHAGEIIHGKTCWLTHDNSVLYHGIPKPFEAVRYHSLVSEKNSLPNCFKITAQTENGLIMSVSCEEKNAYGVQYHPESYRTNYGYQIIQNFLKYIRK